MNGLGSHSVECLFADNVFGQKLNFAVRW